MLVLLLVLAVGACTQAPRGPCQMGRVATLPIRIDHGRVLIRATLNGAPAELMFDTGSFTSILTGRAVRRLKLRSLIGYVGQIGGIGGLRAAGTVAAEQFELGGMHGKDFIFLESDIFGDRAHEPDGVVSTDFLDKYDIDLDFPDHQIVLYLPIGACNGQPGATLDQPLYTAKLLGPEIGPPNTFARTRTPMLIASVNGQNVVAGVDTGAGHSAIYRDVAVRQGLDVDALIKARHWVGYGVGPNAVRETVQSMASIEVGDITIHNMPVAILDQHRRSTLGMLLGVDFLSRVHVWISYSSNTLIMQYPPRSSPAR